MQYIMIFWGVVSLEERGLLYWIRRWGEVLSCGIVKGAVQGVLDATSCMKIGGGSK